MHKISKTVTYSSIFADVIQDFINTKRALGYKYCEEASALRRFDRYCISINHVSLNLSKELVLSWISKRPHETDSNQKSRTSTIRLLAAHMVEMGYEAYIYPIRVDKIQRNKFVPYIFSTKELSLFFEQVDKCKPVINSEKRHYILPLLFRMLYGCGFRISEVLNLKVADINLQDGTITVLNSKFGKDRLVPMTSSLISHCHDYIKAMHLFSKSDNYFFPSPMGGCYSSRVIYGYYRKFLWQASISHGGRGKGPRMHDLRHTFAVHSLRNFVLTGTDLSIALPYLSTYLGHVGIQSTQYYLRLTAELYPDIISKVENKFGNVIPESEVTVYE